MKPLLFLLVAALVFASCTKEETKQPAENSFQVNESLIDSASVIYFVADVEGIPGVTKLIYQDAFDEECIASTGHLSCSNDAFDYMSSISDVLASNTYYIDVMRRKKSCAVTTCPMSEVLPLGDHPMVSAYDSYADGFYFQYYNTTINERFSSVLVDNTALTESMVKLLSVQESIYCDVNSAYELFEIKLHFNATLGDGQGNTIKFKNAVFRAVIAI